MFEQACPKLIDLMSITYSARNIWRKQWLKRYSLKKEYSSLG